jgi:hypothetical protein
MVDPTRTDVSSKDIIGRYSDNERIGGRVLKNSDVFSTVNAVFYEVKSGIVWKNL